MARTSGQLIKEKVPLFAVVAVLCVSTVFSQHRVGALSDFGHLPLAARLPTVLAAYGTYLAQTFWPAGLCVLYPLPKTVPMWQWAGSASLLAAVTVGCLTWGRRLPCLPVGWFWFLGILVPVIGLVQVGEQGHADRYTYIPLVGVFIMLVWPVVACAERNARLARALPWLAAAVLVACAVASLRQVRHWENSITIFTRAATVTKDNVTAMNNIAAELRAIGQIKESVVWLEKSIAIRAGQGQLYNLALSQRDLGDMLKAQYYAYHAFKLDPRGKVATTMYEMLDAMAREQPDKPGTWKLLAVADQVRGDDEATMRHLAEVIRTDPQDVGARIDRSAFLARRGRETEAITLLQEALTLAPTNTMARGNLAALLVKQGRHAEGLPHYEAALKATPDNPDLRHNYALLLSRTHKVPEARREFEAILRTHPKHVPAHQQLAWLLATRTECRNGPEALRLAKAAAELTPAPTPLQLDVLAAAHAATGDFDTAVTLATTGINLARTAKLTQLEDAMRDRLRLYRDRQPYTAD